MSKAIFSKTYNFTFNDTTEIRKKIAESAGYDDTDPEYNKYLTMPLAELFEDFSLADLADIADNTTTSREETSL